MIVIGVRAVGSLSRDAGLLDWIRGVVEKGWRIELAAPHDVAQSLIAALSTGLSPERMVQLSARRPSMVDLSFIAIRDWVCVSTLDWLDADVSTPCWTVLLEQRGLIEKLLVPKQR